jgi:hypothetical protein
MWWRQAGTGAQAGHVLETCLTWTGSAFGGGRLGKGGGGLACGGGRLGMWKGHAGHVMRAGSACDGGRLGLAVW